MELTNVFLFIIVLQLWNLNSLTRDAAIKMLKALWEVKNKI